jgi:hypothetical protein
MELRTVVNGVMMLPDNALMSQHVAVDHAESLLPFMAGAFFAAG